MTRLGRERTGVPEVFELSCYPRDGAQVVRGQATVDLHGSLRTVVPGSAHDCASSARSSWLPQLRRPGLRPRLRFVRTLFMAPSAPASPAPPPTSPRPPAPPSSARSSWLPQLRRPGLRPRLRFVRTLFMAPSAPSSRAPPTTALRPHALHGSLSSVVPGSAHDCAPSARSSWLPQLRRPGLRPRLRSVRTLFMGGNLDPCARDGP